MTEDTIQYGKIKTTITLPDGNVINIYKSKYDYQNASIKEELEISVDTTPKDLLGDLLDALSVITKGETRELVLTIKADSNSQVNRILKRYVISSENLGRLKH